MADASPDLTRQPPPPTPEPRISTNRLRVPRKARQFYDKAVKAFAKMQYPRAQVHLDKALALYARFPEALTLYAMIQFTARNWPAAESYFQAAIQADSTFLPPYLGMADLYNVELRYDDALDMLERANAQSPGTWRGHYETAWALIGKKQYHRALQVTEDGLRRHAAPPPLLHLVRAHALVGLKKFPLAVKELQAYLHAALPDADAQRQARILLDQLQAAMGP